MDIREELEQERLALIRHLTALDATLLGILTVFQDKLKLCLFPLSLTTVGMTLLFLSLAGGIYHLYMAYKTDETVYLHLVETIRETDPLGVGAVKSPIGTIAAAKACAICLCLGVLSLLVGAFL